LRFRPGCGADLRPTAGPRRVRGHAHRGRRANRDAVRCRGVTRRVRHIPRPDRGAWAAAAGRGGAARGDTVTSCNLNPAVCDLRPVTCIRFYVLEVEKSDGTTGRA